MPESLGESPGNGSLADRMQKRARELRGTGMEWGQAYSTAWLEERIRQWPVGWGDDLNILIYGDFKPPKAEIKIEPLGIIIHPGERKNTVIESAYCVAEATVKIEGKSVASLLDAARRINVLLGVWTLVDWGHCACGWWSWVTHDTIGGIIGELDHEHLLTTVNGILQLPQLIRQKVDAALYWLREPRSSFQESYRRDVLRIYTAYWNAFECLVEAVNLAWPRRSLSTNEKQRLVDEFVSQRQGMLTVKDIQKCYQEVVNPGLVGKATYALQRCFPKHEAQRYISECFRTPRRRDRLYDIRNAINHGEVDAENLDELIRIESRLRLLWRLVWQIFGHLVPFPAPAVIAENDRKDADS